MSAVRFTLLVAVLITISWAPSSARRTYRGSDGDEYGSGSSNYASSRNFCEDEREFHACRKDCYADRSCNDEANLNCSVKCKQACLRNEKLGRCRAAMLATILRVLLFDLRC